MCDVRCSISNDYLYGIQKSFFLTMQLLFFSLGLPGIPLCCSLRYQKQIKVYFSALKLSPLLKIIYKKTRIIWSAVTLCLSAAALSSRSFLSVGWTFSPSSHHWMASEKWRSSIQHWAPAEAQTWDSFAKSYNRQKSGASKLKPALDFHA